MYLLVLLVGLGGLLGQLLVAEDAKVSHGGPDLTLGDHLPENLYENMTLDATWSVRLFLACKHGFNP